MHGISVAADHVGKMPARRCQDPVFGQDRHFHGVSSADTACALIAIGNAIELQPYFALGDTLDRNLNIAKTEGGIVARAVRVEIEGANLAMRTCAEPAVARHLRVRTGRRARRQRTKRAKLRIGIARTQDNLPVSTGRAHS